MGGYVSIVLDSFNDCWKHISDIYYGNRSSRLPTWSTSNATTTTTTMHNQSNPISSSSSLLIQSNNYINDYNTINNDNNQNEFMLYYNIIERCHTGNLSSYYHCQHKSNQQEYLFKIINNNTINNNSNNNNSNIIYEDNKCDDNNDDNNIEIKILKTLNHPNIIKLENIYHYNTSINSIIYIVFEPLKGGYLFQYIIEKGSITEEEGSIIIRKICSAIAYLHSLDIVHRDIQADSFAITSKDNNNMEIKLINFGCAKDLKSLPHVNNNIIVGAKGYIAPEVLLQTNNNYNSKAVDVWALGIISYLILNGSFPFDDSIAKIPSPSAARKKFQLRFPAWSNNVSASAKDLLHNILEVDPDNRYTANKILQHPWISGKNLLKNNILISPQYLAEKNVTLFRKPLHPYLSESNQRLAKMAKIQTRVI